MNPARVEAGLKAIWSVAEPLLVLAGAALLTLALSLPLTPLELQLEVSLRPSSADPAWTPGELAAHVEARGLAAETQLVTDDSGSRLQLVGVDDAGSAIKHLRLLLDLGGYEQAWVRTAPRLDLTDLVQENPKLLPAILSIQAVVFLVVGLLMARWRLDRSRATPQARPIRAVLIGVGGGIAAVVFSGVASALLEWMGWPVQEQPWLEDLLADADLAWQLAPWVVLFVPIAEEVFFRGYVFRFITQRLGFLSGILLSSVIFASIHLNFSGFPLYLIIAMIMAWVYHRSGSLASPIIAHMTLNGFVLLAGVLAR